VTLDLCIPAYNEARIIGETLRAVIAALEKSSFQNWRITVVDNGSDDGTGAAVQVFADPRVSILRIETRGKGAAIKAAAEKTSAELFGFIDADLSADPNDIFTLARLVENGSADIAIGSRLLDTRRVARGFGRTLSSRVFNLLRGAIIGINVVDSQCGLKLMNASGRTVIKNCTENGWFLDLELLARAERAGLFVREVPIRWSEEHFIGRRPKLRVFRDGFGALRAMFRIRQSLRNLDQ
jgi:glycosyltransferase involved in cell wall biosynthesis